MATVIKTKTGKKVVLYNPAEKGKRYARQLRNGKVAETGKKLTNTDKAYRAGYLSARSDNAKAYCAKKGVKGTTDAALKRLSALYAEHMGSKFNLSKSEISKNAAQHYKEAIADKAFRAYLEREYN
jgi:hypothetical protein